VTVSIEELIDSLFTGLDEAPLWDAFLDKLRAATCVDRALFQCHPPGGLFSRAVYRLSGLVEDEDDFFREVMSIGAPPSDLVEEGKPHDLLGTIMALAPPGSDPRKLMETNGITALRALKVTEPSGVEAWLFLTNIGPPWHPEADAIVEAIAPVLRGVIGVYVSREQERYRAALAMQAARRANTGWLTLDEQARVIEYDEGCAKLLSNSSVLQVRADGSLKIEPPQVERKVRQSIDGLSQGKAVSQQVIRLSRRPWIEITLQPARRTPVSTKSPAVALIYVNHDIDHDETEHDDLKRILGLSDRETELAIALGQGVRINEAAEDLGLTVNTVRSYLRSIYAKTGATGLPDLVRIVNRSLHGHDAQEPVSI
jgi:DNA-binding CsgD family transcriptional regulator